MNFERGLHVLRNPNPLDRGHRMTAELVTSILEGMPEDAELIAIPAATRYEIEEAVDE